MNEIVDMAMLRFTEEAKKVYGDKLNKVILYGSAARDDYDDDSDVDIMLLLNVEQDSLEMEREKLLSITDLLDDEFDYELLFSPLVQSIDLFNDWADVLPFYKNVKKEGVVYGT